MQRGEVHGTEVGVAELLVSARDALAVATHVVIDRLRDVDLYASAPAQLLPAVDGFAYLFGDRAVAVALEQVSALL